MKKSSRNSEQRVVRLLSTPRRLLVSILVGNTLVNIAAASLGTTVAIDLLSAPGTGQAVGEGMLWATLTMTVLILFTGEIAPKSIALENSERLSRIVARPLLFFITFIKPVRILLEWTNNLLFSSTEHSFLAGPDLSSGTLATAVRVGHDEGVLDTFEREVINNILDLERRTTGEIMTPRVEVISLDVDAPPDEWSKVFSDSGFSRIPVIDGDLDNVTGVFYAKDYLAVQTRGTSGYELKGLLRDPYFVPESMKVIKLLGEFRRRQLHFALVIDEYGSVSGVVTMEDVLEEIVGEITDSRDEEEAPFKLLTPGVAVVYAGWELDQFARATGTSLKDDYAETVGGWLVNRLGRIPKTGETVQAGPFRLHVLSARPTRVLWLRVEWKE